MASNFVTNTSVSPRNRSRVGEEEAEIVEPVGIRPARLVRVDAQARVDARLAVGKREDVVRSRHRGRDRDHLIDARCAGLGECLLGCAGLEVRMRVDHVCPASPSGSIRRSSSSTISGSSLRKSGRGSRNV